MTPTAQLVVIERAAEVLKLARFGARAGRDVTVLIVAARRVLAEVRAPRRSRAFHSSGDQVLR